MTTSIDEAAGGTGGMRRLAAAWHARVLADDVVSRASSHRFRDDHTERLAACWGEALGGPAADTELRSRAARPRRPVSSAGD